jgi:hypothetical protein
MAREAIIQGLIADQASHMGYNVSKDASKLSGSKYIGLSHDKLPDTFLKVRVSDHDLPPSYGHPGDYDVEGKGRPSGNGMHWSDAINHLAGRVGAEVPPAAKRELTRRADADKAQQDKQRQEMSRSPSVQESTLSQAFPKEWAASRQMQHSAGRDARKALAAKYEAANPGKFEWAPHFKPNQG